MTTNFFLTALAFLTLASVIIWCLGILLDELYSIYTGETTWAHSFGLFDSNRKVGGIRFMKIGRLNISVSLSKKGA